MNRTALALVAGAAFGVVVGGVGIASAGDDGSRDDDRPTAATTSTVTAQPGQITEEEARGIAVAAVGGGHVESVELEVEDGGLQWHIDVINGGVEFDVRIDADTGEVVRFRTDDGGDQGVSDDRRDDDGDDDRDGDRAARGDDDNSNSGPGSGDDDHGDGDDDNSNSGPGSDDDDDDDDNSGPGGDDD